MLRYIGRVFLILFLAALGYGIWYAIQALPIVSAYGAKNLCSGVWVSGREPDDVIEQELGTALSSLGTYTIDTRDSSATGSVWSFFQVKSIYRKGLGCTLVNERSEAELRDQRFRIAAAPHNDADTIPWPAGDRLTDRIPAGIDAIRLKNVVESAFAESDPEHPVRTRAVIVVYRDTIIAERYAAGFDRHTPLCGWSMTKSITNAMIGLLVADGKLDPDAPAPVKQWSDDARRNITLRHLMQASSGLDWTEDYSGPSDATRMLFRSSDAGKFAVEKKALHPPDTKWVYSSGTTNILSRIIRETLGDEQYHRFPYERLFRPVGMNSMVIEPDPDGTFVGSSYSYGSARDWARFGLLYLHDGIWQGRRMLPEGWVSFTSTPARSAPRGEYGAQWWLNAGAPGNPQDRTYPDVPEDSFQAEGFEGQYVFVIPSRQLVVVRLGLTQGRDFDANGLVSGIISSISR